jgi:ketosteroid isomerase-like protein
MQKVTERVEAEVAVLEANRRFYRAFSEGDYDSMNQLWAEHAPTACAHPGMGVIVGRSAILGSWKQILRQTAGWTMSCRAARVHLLGDVAFVTCLEANGDQPAHLVATNVFLLESGHWRMVHHQAGPLSQPVAAGDSRDVN